MPAEKLHEIIESIRETQELPVVLGGDFNQLLANDVLSPLHDTPDADVEGNGGTEAAARKPKRRRPARSRA